MDIQRYKVNYETNNFGLRLLFAILIQFQIGPFSFFVKLYIALNFS